MHNAAFAAAGIDVSPCPYNSLAQIMLHRNITFGLPESHDVTAT